MITAVIARCEVCQATETIPAQHGAAERLGGKFENGMITGIHLCPDHSDMTWKTVKAKPLTQ